MTTERCVFSGAIPARRRSKWRRPRGAFGLGVRGMMHKTGLVSNSKHIIFVREHKLILAKIASCSE